MIDIDNANERKGLSDANRNLKSSSSLLDICPFRNLSILLIYSSMTIFFLPLIPKTDKR